MLTPIRIDLPEPIMGTTHIDGVTIEGSGWAAAFALHGANVLHAPSALALFPESIPHLLAVRIIESLAEQAPLPERDFAPARARIMAVVARTIGRAAALPPADWARMLCGEQQAVLTCGPSGEDS